MSDSARGAVDGHDDSGLDAREVRCADRLGTNADLAELVLSEAHGEWTLHVSATLLDTLTTNGGANRQDRFVTVAVRPNLVPGEAFSARLLT